MEKHLQTIPVLETPHYLLREVRPEDQDAMFSFLSDPDTMKFITPHPVSTLNEVEKRISEQLVRFTEGKEIPWVMVWKEQNRVIGTCRLHKLRLWHQSTELGVVIHKDFQKRGVMTEILPVILDYSFSELKLNRIVGDIFTENQGSKKLLEQFGFQLDGILRQTDFDGEAFHDTAVYSMLKEDYFNQVTKPSHGLV